MDLSRRRYCLFIKTAWRTPKKNWWARDDYVFNYGFAFISLLGLHGRLRVIYNGPRDLNEPIPLVITFPYIGPRDINGPIKGSSLF